MNAKATHRMTEAEGEPSIHGAVIASLRADLIAQGRWDDVREALSRLFGGTEAAEWLSEAAWTTPVDLAHYAQLLEAVGAALGSEGLFELGRRRILGDLESGLFSTILRSWLRSFGSRPEQVVQVSPYLFRAALRDAGTMKLEGSGKGFIRYRLVDCPRALYESRVWHRLLEGIGQGIFDLAAMTGSVQVRPSLTCPDAVDFLCMWEAI